MCVCEQSVGARGRQKLKSEKERKEKTRDTSFQTSIDSSISSRLSPAHAMASRDVLHVLTEFRAGLMRKDGTKLAADPRRGLVRVVRVRVGRLF